MLQEKSIYCTLLPLEGFQKQLIRSVWVHNTHVDKQSRNIGREKRQQDIGFLIPYCTAGVERLAGGLGDRSLESTELAAERTAMLGPAKR